MKKVLVLALALAMVLGCTAIAEGNLIGYTCMDGTNPFFVTLEASIKEVVEANGDELISLDPQNSNEKQISQIEDLISQGIVAMFVNPVDRDGIIAGLDKLKGASLGKKRTGLKNLRGLTGNEDDLGYLNPSKELFQEL